MVNYGRRFTETGDTMNSKRKNIIVIVITLTAGIISFLNARMTAMSEQDRAQAVSYQWLEDAPRTVAESEAKFNNEVENLIANLESLQKSLIAALEDPCTPDAIITKDMNDVIAAHKDLILRVGEHVVKLRHQLGRENREYLMQLCTEAVSGQMRRLGARMGGQGGRGYGYRYGRQGRGGRGYGYRGGSGQEKGTGYGQRSRFRDRLANRLKLTFEQVMLLQENDPNFESESVSLYETLMEERDKLLSVFENPESSDDEMLNQIENLVSTHSRIERRIAEHVLILRPYLTVEQQKWLIGLCRRFDSGE
jgi:hypothetical protein